MSGEAKDAPLEMPPSGERIKQRRPIKDDNAMKCDGDGEKFWLYCAIISCCKIEQTGLKNEAGYATEAQRKYYDKLNKDGLIFSESVPGKCHWVRFRGFSPRGRQMYLDENGNIRDEYNLEAR